MKSQWNRLPTAFISTMNNAIVTKSADIALRLFDSVVELSPVRTGQFRASWKLSINSQDTSLVIGGSPTNPLSPPKRPVIGRLKRNDKIYISNAHRYGQYLEYGTPSMVPVGMIRKSLARIR